MARLPVSSILKGKFGEACFEEYLDKTNSAYIHSKEIWQTLKENSNELFFRHKFEMIKTFLPWEVLSEIYVLSRPSNIFFKKNASVIRQPSWVYDYLTVSLDNFQIDEDNLHYRTKPVPLEDLSWAEVKYNKSRFTKNQLDIRDKTIIPTKFFWVRSNPIYEVRVDEVRKLSKKQKFS
jgi:hypothetical protein